MLILISPSQLFVIF
jgi:hypothetical protein